MPDSEAIILAKLDTLRTMRDGGASLLFSEIVRIDFPLPDGPRAYCFTQLDETPGFTGVRELVPYEINTRILVTKGQPFIKLPRTAGDDDDKIDLNFSDIDGEMSRLTHTYGQGVRVRVYSYYPQVDLLVEDWTGTLGAPKDADGVTLKLPAVAGYRSPNLLLPNRLPASTCQFIYGGHLSSQQEIDDHKGCPYNAHLGGPVGVPGLPDCARDSVATCSAHLLTRRFWPGYDTVIESIANNQTSGPNLRATARGNEGALTDPIRMSYGERMLKALRLMAYRVEVNTNHPEKGFLDCVFEVEEGPVEGLWDFRILGVPVGFEHLNIRLGELGQPATFFSPNFNPYSGTAHARGRIQGDFRNVTPSSVSATIRGRGLRDVRVYSDPDTFVETYTNKPVWCVADMLTRKRSAYGEDYARYNKASMIETAAWHDEQVAFHDPNGNVFAGTRSTFNAEINARSTHQQIYDACVAARMAVPFMWGGEKHFYGLRKEAIDGRVPVFTTEGADANICLGEGRRPAIRWSYKGDDVLINQVVVNLDDASNNFAQTSLTFGDQLQQLKAGKAWNDKTVRRIVKTYPALGITNVSEAARLGNLLLYLGPLDSGGIRNNLQVTFTTWFSQALRIKPYQLVRLVVPRLARYGFDYFRVMKITRLPDLRVELEVQAYPVEFYERMEDVTQPPPEVGSGFPGNTPRGGRPEPIGLLVNHTADGIRVRLNHGALGV